MFTKMLKYAIAAAALVVFTGSAAWAQSSDSASGTGKAFVVKPLTIVWENDLLFGTFTAGTGGSVTIQVNGLPSTDDDVTFVPGTGNLTSQAVFFVTGQNGEKFNIAVAPDPLTLLNGAGNASMSVDLLHLNSALFPGNGETTIEVGGILTVNNGQLPDTYTGEFTVTVTYQ